jgi:hypothetical protein
MARSIITSLKAYATFSTFATFSTVAASALPLAGRAAMYS